jgi:hypothetical protein
MQDNTEKDMNLIVGTILKDKMNEYIIRDVDYKNTHSQYPSQYLIECYSGPNEGKVRWVSAAVAIQYQGGWENERVL